MNLQGENKRNNKHKWFKSRGYAAVLNVPVTPGGILKANIAKRLGEQDMGDDVKLLVREMPGSKISNQLLNHITLGRPDDCGRVDCLPCVSSGTGSKGACWQQGPTYEMECGPCKKDGRVTTYTGESGYSSYTRAVSHRAGLQSEDPRSALWQHAVDSHEFRKGDGRHQELKSMFKMKITGSHNSSSRRLISEAIRIEDSVRQRDKAQRSGEGEERVVLNSVRQWFQPGIIRVRASRTFSYGDRARQQF